MSKHIAIASFIIVATSFLFSCAASHETAKPEIPPIRVGVTPNYPPIIFKTDGRLSGAEVDMAQLLGEALRRPVKFIELEWDEQIPALLAGKTDIIMSGMSITDARKVRINFAEPYMKAGLATAMRAEDASYYDSKRKIQEAVVTIGAMANTTGDVFVQKNFPDAIRISVRTMKDAVYSLKNRRIDFFIHDAPAIAWLVSENEADLKGFWQLWNVEYLGWGIRREDQDFLASVNSILNKWKNDGTLDKVLNQWVPYMKKMVQLFGFLDPKKFFEADKSAAFVRGKSEGEVKK